MKDGNKIDAARIELLLGELRLSGVKLVWAALAETADKEGWPAARFLAALAEQEMVERSRRRFQRHLEEARLPPGKTLDTFDFAAVPMISKAQVQALAAGDAWIEKGANLLCFGPPGGGKSHLAAALGLALIEKAGACLFTRTTDLVQKLQIARRDLVLEAAIAKLDKYHLLILDDLAYVTKDQAETSVLFELISARYERRSMLITANQLFGEWEGFFPSRDGHDAPIFERLLRLTWLFRPAMRFSATSICHGMLFFSCRPFKWPFRRNLKTVCVVTPSATAIPERITSIRPSRRIGLRPLILTVGIVQRCRNK